MQIKYDIIIDSTLLEVLYGTEKLVDYELDIVCPRCNEKNIGKVIDEFYRCVCGYYFTTNFTASMNAGTIPYLEV